jgi:tetratricopeptide (TPR) repeat protein
VSPRADRAVTSRTELVLFSAAFFVIACGRPLARAEAQFADGRYPEAKHALLALEAESATWSDANRAEYALYRGLTLAALGDREQARVWLREARAIEDSHPKSLSYEDVQRLKLAEGSVESE